MFSPDRFGSNRKTSFGLAEDKGARNFVSLKTVFGRKNSKEGLTAVQKAAHTRYSEPATPSVLKDRGLRPSDLSDPHKKDFLTNLTTRIFHLSLEEGDGPRESIPLERLFTPATDSGEITPRKKKAFSSSAFYAPNHPTIEDQVSLAQKISTSLIDENNKMSRGQSMYIKRKKRSVKWIHQADGFEDDGTPERVMQSTMQSMPAMEIKTGLKVQTEMRSEHTEMQQHLQQVTVAGQPICNPGMKMRPAELQSPTGKGAELFAKRKKRMDQFIVDETNVKQSAVSSSRHQEQTSVMSSETSSFNQQSMVSSTQVTEQKSSKISSGTQYLRSTCTAVQPTVDSTVHGSAGEGGAVYTAEVKVVQRASLPPTPAATFEIPEDMPHHSILLEQYDNISKEEKRKSFNFAAKGWGTYNNFYTPITFTATS